MTQKFTHSDYTVFTTFRNENCLTLMVSSNIMPQNYINDSIQLSKIKKDTVIAALQKRNQKNLRCQFSYKKVGHQQHQSLVLSIIVSYDFLPEFKEDIILELMKKQDSQKMTRIQAVSFENQIAQLTKQIDSLSKGNPAINSCLTPSTIYTEGAVIGSLNLQRGSYLLQISGFCNTNTGMMSLEQVTFVATHSETQKIKFSSFKPYINSSYGYPFSLSEVLNVIRSGPVSVICKGQEGGNVLTIQNSYIIAQAIVQSESY